MAVTSRIKDGDSFVAWDIDDGEDDDGDREEEKEEEGEEEDDEGLAIDDDDDDGATACSFNERLDDVAGCNASKPAETEVTRGEASGDCEEMGMRTSTGDIARTEPGDGDTASPNHAP